MTDRLTEIAIQLAQISGLDHQRYDYVSERGLHDDPWNKNLYLMLESQKLALVKEYESLGGIVYSMSIGGCAGDPEISNYDLDDKIKAEFGIQVSCDSESGGLFIDTIPSVCDEVLARLRELDPEGSFSADNRWDDEGKEYFNLPRTDRGMGCWDSNARFLAGLGVEQKQLDFSEAPTISEEQVKQADKDIRAAIKKRYPQLTEQHLNDLMPLVDELLDGFVDWVDAEL